MTTPTSQAPSRVALVTLSVLVGVLAVFVCVLYALTPSAQRLDLLRAIAPLVGGAALGLPAVLGALTGRRNARQLDELHETARRIDHQTNGELTRRLHEAVSAQLDARGLTVPEQAADVPEQRAPAAVEAIDTGERWWDVPAKSEAG